MILFFTRGSRMPRKSDAAAKDDLQTAQDLLDTLMAHRGSKETKISAMPETFPDILKSDGCSDT